MTLLSVSIEKPNKVKIQIKVEEVKEVKITCNGLNLFYKFDRQDSKYYKLYLNIKPVKESDKERYVCTLNSEKMNMKNFLLLCDDSEFRQIPQSFNYCDVTDLSIEVDKKIQGTQNQFSILYEDTELTDFELRGEDGSSVQVHSAVLAASSPVLRAMLGKQYKETKDRSYHIKDATQATLQQLKDFMYNKAIPETGYLELLQLAQCYMMHELQKVCFEKVVEQFQI